MQVQPEKDALTHDLLRQNGGAVRLPGSSSPAGPSRTFLTGGANIPGKERSSREKFQYPEINASPEKGEVPGSRRKRAWYWDKGGAFLLRMVESGFLS